MHFVYILKSKNYNKFYTGCTNDINKRLEQHNSGNSLYTKRFSPWIIHHVEKYNDKKSAFQREKYLKSHTGRNWIKNHIVGS